MAYYKQPLLTESVSAVTATPSVELGTKRIVDGREYIYAYNAGGAQASQYLVVQRAAGAEGESFTVTTTVDPYIAVMGVVHNATFTTATYGWLLKRGATRGIFADSNTTGPVAMAKYPNLHACADGTVGPSTGGTGTTGIGAMFGRALSAVSDITGASFAMYVDCRG